MKTETQRTAELERRVRILEQLLEEERRRARTDALTGLDNRTVLEERRLHARDGWFVLCDLNGFKAAQDAHPDGHAHGDAVLREFAEFLRTNCRTLQVPVEHERREYEPKVSSDFVAVRSGGDEFVVWCSHYDGAERIRAQVLAWSSRIAPAVTAACGIGRTMDVADQRMYLSKRETKS